MKNVIITIFSQNYIFFTNLALYMIGKKGASCRKDHGQRNILIHKRKFCCHTNREGGISARGYEMNEIRWEVSLMPEEANACGKRGNALRGRLQVLANVWGKGCKRLRQRMQTFEAKVANVWGKGCNALRLRWVKLALKSSVLFWIREKGGETHPLRVTIPPLWCIWWSLIPHRPWRNP